MVNHRQCEQKGSLVAPDHLRFDFSHFSKLSKEEIYKVEALVNQKIRENIVRDEEFMSFDEAKKSGAMALFGEKYSDTVRVITFDENFSKELCGGTHVKNTGEIWFFKIISEAAVASGIRRIEAVTDWDAMNLIYTTFNRIEHLQALVGSDLEKSIGHLQDENSRLKKQVEEFSSLQINRVKEELKSKAENINGINFIAEEVSVPSADALKKLAFDLRNEVENLFFVAGTAIDGKANLCIIIAEDLVQKKSLDAGKIIKAISKEINGGGGGQKFFASAGGTNVNGISKAISLARNFLPQ